MGLMSSELRAVLQAGEVPAAWVFEVALPGNTMRLSMGGFSALGVGNFDARIKSISSIAYDKSDRAGNVPALEMTFDVINTARDIDAIVEGVSANEVIGSAVTAYLVAKHPTVNRSKWFTAFVGILSKDPEFPEPGLARFTARVDDLAFSREMLRDWRITRANWPYADADVINQIGILVYGEHSAANHQVGPGMVPLRCVDNVAFRYGPIIGKPKAFDRVYVGDVQTGLSWSTEYLTRDGRQWTVVKFTSAPGGAVSVDMKGVEAVGDTTGALLTNKAAQHAHLLSQFCFGAYKTGAWLATSSRIDSSLTGTISAFLAARGSEGSLCIKDITTPAAIIAKLCDEESIHVRWTNLGKLAFAVDGLFRDAYAEEKFDWYTHESGKLNITNDEIDLTSGIQVGHVPAANQGTFLSSFSVDDVGALETAPDSINMTTSAAK